LSRGGRCIIRNIGRAERRVLVVEDEPAIGVMCRRALAKVGLEVDVAINSEVAQDMIGKEQYDLLLIDIRTPVMNGTQLYLWLQKNYPRLAQRVIFTTGSVMDEDTMAFIREAGRPYLPKPFNPKELTEVVQSTLKQIEKG